MTRAEFAKEFEAATGFSFVGVYFDRLRARGGRPSEIIVWWNEENKERHAWIPVLTSIKYSATHLRAAIAAVGEREKID